MGSFYRYPVPRVKQCVLIYNSFQRKTTLCEARVTSASSASPCCRYYSYDAAESDIRSENDERKKNVGKVEVPEGVRMMRSRMREIHGLSSADAKPLRHGDRIQRNGEVGTRNHEHKAVRAKRPSSDEMYDDVASPDAEFIRNIGKPDLKHADVYVQMPFGLARFDSMNVCVPPQVKQKSGSDKSAVSESSKHEAEAVIRTNTNLDYKVSAGQNFSHADEKHERSQLRNTESHFNIFDEQYFGSLVEKNVDQVSSTMKSSSDKSAVSQSSKHEAEAVIRTNTNLDCKVSAGQNFSHADEKHERSQLRNTESHFNIFDEQYFGSLVEKNVDQVSSPMVEKSCDPPENIIEEQYFGQSASENSSFNVLSKVELADKSRSSSRHQFNINNVIREQSETVHDFNAKSQLHKNKNTLVYTDTDSFKSNVGIDWLHGQKSKQQDARKPCVSVASESLSHMKQPEYEGVGESDFDDDTIQVETVTRREIKWRSKPVANTENPQTAYDLAVKVRNESRMKKQSLVADCAVPQEAKWTGEMDSKGYRILRNQVLDLQYMTQDEVVSILKDSILYEDDKLLAINKPYGLASHGGPGIHHSVGKLLEPLAHRIDRSGRLGSLHLVHRLDKETTGVMILGKTQQVTEFLLAMFKKRQVIKHYWVITKGVPNPTQGVIDIPMEEATVDGRYRMQLKPGLRADQKTGDIRAVTGSAFEAITNYRVLSSNHGAALVECKPETGVKHQIRCHLSFGLNTPILGDHKYSHYSKMAPQRLYPEMLARLGVRQAKVRHIPMHLHAKAVVLPEWLDGRNLFISARLPQHFVQNMKWLQLKPPSS